MDNYKGLKINMTAQIIQTKNDMHFNFFSLPKIPLPKKVLMVTPTYFNIDNPINAHMLNAEGKPHTLDTIKANEQWNTLKFVYQKLNLDLFILEGVEHLPDMVFCANQSLPYLDKENRTLAFLSNMQNDIRQKEVEHIDVFLKSQKYNTQTITKRTINTSFEGMGDVAWLGQIRFMLGGYGYRTDKNIYPLLSAATDTPIAIFELKNPKFYHLDTCLSVLNSTTALVCKEAFTTEGFQLLEAIFPRLLQVPLKEADAPGFACNAHCPDEKHVIIQKGNKKTLELIQQHNFIPIEVETSEFIKSGGSVYCMKLMFF